MSTMTIGADPDELERVASELRRSADDLDAQTATVTSTLRSVAWVGGVATRFGSQWDAGARRRLRSTTDAIRAAATDLERNAAEQRDASRVSGASLGSSASSSPGGGAGTSGGDGAADRIAGALGRLGAPRDSIEVAVTLAQDLERRGQVGGLIDLLTDDGFVGFLDGAGHVLDAGIVVVDAVVDFADHPGLAFDERVVHSLADAAVRLGLDQGMERAGEWLAGAATTALLPGFGAVLAPFTGKIAGMLAETLMDAAVDVIDGATDVIDMVADAAVAAYREVKEMFGLVADIAEAAVDLVDGAVDGAVDLVGDAAGALLDTGGDLVGAINPFD